MLNYNPNTLFIYFKIKRRPYIRNILFWVLGLTGLLIMRKTWHLISPSEALVQIKRDIQSEFTNFSFSSLSKRANAMSLTDLTPETGGKPIVNVIITNFRSGSTFLGETLNSFPGGYKHFEPLLHYGLVTRITDNDTGARAVSDMLDMLHCDFSNLDHFLDEAKLQWMPIMHNERVYKRLHVGLLYSLDFLSKSCQMFPVQNMKVTRLSLKFAQHLLQDISLNLKVLYLVRDPRAVLASRWVLDWGQNTTAQEICEAMVDDFHAAEYLQQKYPDKFLAIRYENFASQPSHFSQEIFEFLGLPLHKQVTDFIETHTKGFKSVFNRNPSYTTYRNSSVTTFRWLKTLTFKQITDIQVQCHEALKIWGYKEVQSQFELNTN